MYSGLSASTPIEWTSVKKMSESSVNPNMICLKCDAPMELGEVTFNYLGFSFSTELPYCPICGQVYVSEELSKGRMRETELLLEDK